MAINKVVYDGNVLVDLTDSTVTSDKMLEGVTTYDAKGNRITGSLKRVQAFDDGKGNITVNGLSATEDNENITIGG